MNVAAAAAATATVANVAVVRRNESRCGGINPPARVLVAVIVCVRFRPARW